MESKTKNGTSLWTGPLALAALAGGLFGQTSVKSGAFNDPTLWDTGVVPDMDDDVVIQPGHTVGLVPLGLRARRITLGSLTNRGTLLPTYPEGATGQSVRIRALSIVNEGTIRGEDGTGVGGGGKVILTSVWGLLPGFPPTPGPLPGEFVNTGLVAGGDTGVPDSGGRVYVDFRNGTATNSGILEGGGGARGGAATMVATEVVNTGLVRGGDGIDSFGGAARMSASTWPIGGTSSAENYGDVVGGDGGAGRGGSGRVGAFALAPFFDSTALNAEGATIVGGTACEAGSPFLFGLDVENLGLMRVGDELFGAVCQPPARRVYMDPPDGEVTGGADLYGDLVQLVAGSSLWIHDLGPDAVRAEEDLEITLAPGGVLDLTGLAPGSFDVAQETRIRADTVLLPAGLTVDDLFAPSTVTVGPGARHAEPLLDEGLVVSAEPGQKLSIDLTLENAGNQAESYLIEVDGPGSWPDFATTISETAFLGVGSAWSTTVEFQVPHWVLPGEEHELFVTATTTTSGHPVVSTETIAAVNIEAPGCGAETYGAASPLFLNAEAGPVVTAPLLSITGGQPLAPVWLVLSANPVPLGLELGPPLPTLYVDPAGALTVPLLLGPTGSLKFPVNLQGLGNLSIAAQVIQLTDLSGSNGLSLSFCF